MRSQDHTIVRYYLYLYTHIHAQEFEKANRIVANRNEWRVSLHAYCITETRVRILTSCENYPRCDLRTCQPFPVSLFKEIPQFSRRRVPFTGELLVKSVFATQPINTVRALKNKLRRLLAHGVVTPRPMKFPDAFRRILRRKKLLGTTRNTARSQILPPQGEVGCPTDRCAETDFQTKVTKINVT